MAVDGRLYVCLDKSVVVALDQETGREVWRYDPHLTTSEIDPLCRGVAYYEAPTPTPDRT